MTDGGCLPSVVAGLGTGLVPTTPPGPFQGVDSSPDGGDGSACTGHGGDDVTDTAPSRPTTSDNPIKNHEDHDLLLEYELTSPPRTGRRRIDVRPGSVIG